MTGSQDADGDRLPALRIIVLIARIEWPFFNQKLEMSQSLLYSPSREDHVAGLFCEQPASDNLSFDEGRFPSGLGLYPGMIFADVQAGLRLEGFCFMSGHVLPVPEIGRLFGEWKVTGPLILKNHKRCVPCECQTCKSEHLVIIASLWGGRSQQCKPCGRRVAVSKLPRGEEHHGWKGGRTTSVDGYTLIRVGKSHPMAQVTGYALEHRLVGAEKVGRFLTSEEIAHHVDEVKDNNTNNNIDVIPSRSLHMRLHHPTDRDRRYKGDPNPEIQCACGCGTKMLKYDKYRRARKFVSGHNMNI